MFMIITGNPSTKGNASKNEDIVRSYISARNNYDTEKVDALIEDNYIETYVGGYMEIENKEQLMDRILWGKEMDSKIKLLEIKFYFTKLEVYKKWVERKIRIYIKY